MNLTINDIAKACGGRLVLQEGVRGDACVSSVAIDSRKVEAQGVFVAVAGERVDGHSFVASVYEKGAALAVVRKSPEETEKENGPLKRQWGSYLLVEDTLQALKDMAEAYRRKLAVKVVGIAGSAGKTSTKELVAAVLSEKYRVLKTEGNLNNEIGVPLTLLGIGEEHEVAVVEMGISDFGEMHRLSKMARPDVCMITNIGQSHLKDLKTRDGILKAKSEIFDYMAEDGEICLNGEDDKLAAIEEIKGRRPHFFGLGGNPAEDVAVEESVSRGLWGSDATVLIKESICKYMPAQKTGKSLQGTEQTAVPAYRNEKLPVQGGKGDMRISLHIPLPGGHMVLNAAAAVCVAGVLGLSGDEIAAGIAKAVPVGGRDNIIRMPRYTLIDGCYNANPASMKAAIDLLAMADTEKVAILGDMFNLGENSHEYHRQMGAYAAEQGVRRIICVGEESKYMYQAVQTLPQASYFADRQTLMQALLERRQELVPEGATVLIKASHGMEFLEILHFFQGLDS